jgi:hypothetical protein
VQDVQLADVSIEDLLERAEASSTNTQIGKATSMIRLKLPRDGWYPARPLYDWCAEEGIGARTVDRARSKLELDSKKTKTTPAEAMWRWPGSPDTDKSYVGSVVSVGSDGSGHDRHDRQDRQDGENTCRVRVESDQQVLGEGA